MTASTESVVADNWDGGWTRPVLGMLRRRRIRPTHVVGVPPEWQQASFFPKSNRCRLDSSGCHMVWRLHPWVAVDGYIDGVKRRNVHCAVFAGAELACFFEIQQIKNTNEVVWATNLAVCLDDDSAELGELGEVLAKALALEGRDLVEAGEVFTEVHSLFITSAQRGKMVWVKALNLMLNILFNKVSLKADYMLTVLKPLPLEVWSFRSERNREAWSRGEEPQDPDEAEQRNFERRLRALVRLYESRLWFEEVPDFGWMWCAVS